VDSNANLEGPCTSTSFWRHHQPGKLSRSSLLSRLAAAGLFCVTAAGLTPAVASTHTVSAVASGQGPASHATALTPHRPLHGLVFKKAGFGESLVAASPYWLAARSTDAAVWDPPPPPAAPVVIAAAAPAVVVTQASAVAVTPRPAVVAAPAHPAASSPSASSSASLGGAWACIAARESGGNPRAVNPGGYYGMFQFSMATWHSVGGSGNPANASAQEQLMRAQMLQSRSGWGQWSTAHSCGV
jgi:hypothetical protein